MGGRCRHWALESAANVFSDLDGIPTIFFLQGINVNLSALTGVYGEPCSHRIFLSVGTNFTCAALSFVACFTEALVKCRLVGDPWSHAV